MHHVVIDEGSSQIKVCWFNDIEGIKNIIIPSRLVEGSKLADSGEYHEAAYSVNGNEYTVAAYFDGAIRTNTQQYQISEYNRVLVHEALRKAGFGGEDVTIYTTLPISDFYGVKPRNDALIAQKKKNLMGDVLSMAGKELATIVDCKVWPEAIPAWLDLLIDDDGSRKLDADESHKIMVVDIGGTTTDLTIIDGTGNLQDFHSVRKGVFDISENITPDLITEFKRKHIEAHQLDKALREKTFAGSDITKLIDKACRPVVRDIHLEMVRFARESSNLDSVLYVGGGSSLIAKQLGKEYGGKSIIRNDMTIARGILKKLINSQVVA